MYTYIYTHIYRCTSLYFYLFLTCAKGLLAYTARDSCLRKMFICMYVNMYMLPINS